MNDSGLQIFESSASQVTKSGLETNSWGLTILSSPSGENLGAQANASDGSEITVVVAPGDTMGSIALRELGDVLKFRAIFDANRDRISDPNNLVPGTRLIIPDA